MKKLKRDKIPKKIEHRWELNSFTDNATFCNHCNIIIVQGLICSICQRTCHLDHLKEVDALDCKCGCYISPNLPKVDSYISNSSNAKWYQKGLIKRGSSWISKTSKRNTKTEIKLGNIENNQNRNENIVEIKENIVDNSNIDNSLKKRGSTSLDKIIEDNEYATNIVKTPLVAERKLSKNKNKLIREMSKKEEELLKEVLKHPQREESVVYPNEEVNKTELDKTISNRSVLLKGSSYYSINKRGENLVAEPSSYDDFGEVYDPYSSILKDSETGKYNHQWVKYKTQSPYFCQVCNKRISNGPFDFDYHCVWCQICVHKKCIEKYSNQCYLSIIPEIVMPPHYISLCNRKKKTRDEVVPKYNISALEGDDLITKRPLICVINPKSGEGATNITREMYSLLNPVQICDITYDNPEEVILSFIKCYSNCRIIACGGDGTVSWMNSIFDKFLKEKLLTRDEVPPIGVIPLGTGNDLSRVLGWGGGYEGENAIKLFRDLTFDSEVIEMDRWKVEVIPDKSFLQKLKLKQGPKTIIMNNYFSIGSDANIAYAFHTTRKEHPSLFKSRVVNKIWYFSLGGVEYFKSIYNNAAGHIVGLFRHKNNDSDNYSNESKKILNNSDTLLNLNPENSEDNYSFISDNTTNNGNNDDKISIASNSKSRRKSKKGKGNNSTSQKYKNKEISDAVTVDSDSLSINDKKSIQSSIKTNDFSSFDDVVELELDGKQIDVNNLSGIIIMNINSYGGGSKFFQKEGDGDSGILPLIKNAFNSQDYPDYSCNDHQLEVVGVFSALHAGISLAGVITPAVLGVVKESLKLTIHKKMAVQVDGEPWMQNPSVIEITFNNKTKYLKHKGTNLY
ncbi:hypothetical protein BCR36DRAFT_394247 [Piromyces finnis]|uniref:Diacylglycerol kinase n=1 Tax=Piromyces finnis TaxID=1754191 RepID=A0A1Y1VPR5_9FUNG|nr:hypothetical protein BCR36DRAFT_394247 [Piromyces finnis]|eukprot:ORX61123.1 hypothetical protein BCR36DRAFT_394247 [Piromyces finnis]